MDHLPVLRAYCETIGFPLDPEREAAFVEFRRDLYATNEVMNLTRIAYEDCEVRHFVDSLLVAPLIPAGSRVVDVGTGPGFPAWPLACARPDLEVTAIESGGKMARFLRSHALTNLRVLQARAEEVAIRETFDFGTGRAVAPLPVQLELTAPLVAVEGLVVPFRTETEEDAIRSFPAEVLGLRLDSVERRTLPPGDVTRLFPVFRKVSPTPRQYPRAWALIRSKPIGTMPA